MPLKSETVEAIFARLLARYGSAWTTKWTGVPQEAVKADWANELAGLTREQIVYALGYLPADFPPTVTQFRAICLRAPERMLPAITEKPDPAVGNAVLAAIRKPAAPDPKEWAWELKAREAAGHRLTKAQRDMWRAALEHELQKSADVVVDLRPAA